MPRTNLKKTKRAIAEAASHVAEAVFSELQREREVDSAHIEEHAESSRQTLEYLAETERRLMDFIREVFGAMRQREQERLRSLISHADDINNDGGDEPAIERKPAVKLVGGAQA